MDFRLGKKSDEFRAEVRAFIDEQLTDAVMERAYSTGTMHDWGFHRALAERGWIAAAWPEEFGGQDRDPFEMTALSEELAAAGAPVDGLGITLMIAQTLARVGTPEQQSELIPRALHGEIILALGYSEPDSGSDVAAARTRAVRDGDEWVIDGQKMFTTLAHEASFVFLLTRTNWDVPKHKGLTMFLVPLDSEGIEIQPIETLGGERTNVTFYNGVRVPDTARVGAVDGGWQVMRVALTFERGGGSAGQMRRLLRRCPDLLHEPSRDGELDALAHARQSVGRLAVDAEVAKLLAYRTVWVNAMGGLAGVEGSMAKLFSSEAFQRACAALLDVQGAEGVLESPGDAVPVWESLEHEFRHSAVTTIYGGSSEIQRSIIAEHRLGLPRGRG